MFHWNTVSHFYFILQYWKSQWCTEITLCTIFIYQVSVFLNDRKYIFKNDNGKVMHIFICIYMCVFGSYKGACLYLHFAYVVCVYVLPSCMYLYFSYLFAFCWCLFIYIFVLIWVDVSVGLYVFVSLCIYLFYYFSVFFCICLVVSVFSVFGFLFLIFASLFYMYNWVDICHCLLFLCMCVSLLLPLFSSVCGCLLAKLHMFKWGIVCSQIYP